MKSFMEVDKEYIYSDEYEKFMHRHLKDSDDMYNLAENSPSFWYRAVTNTWLGVWRWMFAYQYRDLIAKYVFSDLKGVDFGGALGPVSKDVPICDEMEYDIIKRPVRYKKLPENEFDYVFSSHTLEHIQNIDDIVIDIYNSLKNGGKLILFLPSITCKRWNAGDHCSGIANSHVWDMYLSGHIYEKYYRDFPQFIEIDTYLKKYAFKILKAEYCWDNSIFIFAEKY